MAMHSDPRFICCLLLLLATFSAPLQTEAFVDLLDFGGDFLQLLDTWRSLAETAEKKSLFDRLTGTVRTGGEKADWFEEKEEQFRGAAAFEGGGNGAVRTIRTGSLQFPVVAVDVANMLTVTSKCELDSGLGSSWPVTCNFQGYCRLFKETVALESAPPTPEQQATAFYLCTTSSTQARAGGAAILGLGLAGPLAQRFGKFSYLLGLGSEGHTTTTVWLGDGVPPVVAGSPTATIGLIRNPQQPARYYVSVTGIQVDGRPLDGLSTGILELNPRDGTGGVFMRSDPIDTLTYINKAVYHKLVQEFQNSLGTEVISTKEERLCYTSESLANKAIPKLALVFDDDQDAAMMQLKADNYWDKVPANYWGNRQQLECLGILPSPWPTGESVLGSKLQRGWRMTYDLHAGTLQATSAASRLSVLPPVCSVICVIMMILSSAYILLL